MSKTRTEQDWILLVKEFQASRLNLTASVGKRGIFKSTFYQYPKI